MRILEFSQSLAYGEQGCLRTDYSLRSTYDASCLREFEHAITLNISAVYNARMHMLREGVAYARFLRRMRFAGGAPL